MTTSPIPQLFTDYIAVVAASPASVFVVLAAYEHVGGSLAQGFMMAIGDAPAPAERIIAALDPLVGPHVASCQELARAATSEILGALQPKVDASDIVAHAESVASFLAGMRVDLVLPTLGKLINLYEAMLITTGVSYSLPASQPWRQTPR